MPVVIAPPGRDADSGFDQRAEPVLIEAFLSELTGERLDEGSLRGLARLNQLHLVRCARQAQAFALYRDAVAATQFLHRHTGLRLLEEIENLLFSKRFFA